MAAKKRSRRMKGSGALFQRKDGRWTARAYLGPGQSKEVTKATKEAAQDAMREIIRLHEHGVNVFAPTQTLGQFLTQWLNDVQAPRIRPGTLRSYRVYFRRVIALIGHLPLRKLTAQHVQRALAQLHSQGMAASTLNLTRTYLIQALRAAQHWELVSHNVAERTAPFKVPAARRPVVSGAAALRLCTAADGHDIGIVVRLALYLGLRRGELLGLRWQDVDLTRKEIHVETQVQRIGGIYVAYSLKTEKAWRTLPIPPAIATALHEQRARQTQWKLIAGTHWQEHGLVCTTPTGKSIPFSTLGEHFRAALKDAELPPMRLHDLRHSCATMLAAQNTHPRVAQAILGHANITTTLRIYTHIQSRKQLDDAIGSLDAGITAMDEQRKEVG